ncbi:hypothetical protein SDC9_132641 [bioreactor metagenome]|uniref:Uncharacterized protein n=1 Tax=bioreactor metagenome TaxID=1076179 RepID=A0A645D7R2_9ZZZZ
MDDHPERRALGAIRCRVNGERAAQLLAGAALISHAKASGHALALLQSRHVEKAASAQSTEGV